MKGDRESQPAEATDSFGPLLSAVRLNPPVEAPSTQRPPAWAELYASNYVVIRHCWPFGEESTTERAYPTEAKAVRGLAAQIAVLLGRGYTHADDLP